MPDESGAVFQEVLEIRASLPAFRASLQEIEKEWNQFVASLGSNAGPAVGVGAHAQLQAMQKDYQEVYAAINEVVKVANEIKEKTDKADEARTARRSARVKSAAKDEVVATKEITKAQEALAEAEKKLANILEKNDSMEQRRRDIAAGNQGLKDNALSKGELAQQQMLIDAEVAARRAVEEAKLNMSRVRPGEQVDAAHIAASQQDLRLTQEKITAETKLRLMRTRPGEQVDAAHIAAAEQELKLVNAKIAAEEKLRMTRVRPGEELDHQHALALGEAERKHNAELKEKNRLIQQNTKAGQSMFDQWIGGFRGSLIHLTRFYLLMQGLTLLMDLAKHTLGAPFLAMKEGVGYLRDVEKTADELMGVMTSNVKYSDDLAKNYQRSREAAEGTVRAVQEAAIANHVGADQLMGTTKALMEGGATRYTKNMQDLVNLAVMFTQSLKAANVGGLAAQGAIKEVSKLFDGSVTKDNKLLHALKILPPEFNAILTQAKETGNLVELLGPKMQPFLDAVEKGKVHQKVLMDNLALMWKRIQAEGNQVLFEKFNAFLRFVTKWLEDNRERLVNVFKATATAIEGVVRSLATLGKHTGVFTVLKLAAAGFLGILGGINLSLKSTAAVIKFLFDAKNPAKLATAWVEYKKSIDEIMKDGQELKVAIFGGDTGSKEAPKEDPTKQPFTNQNKPAPKDYTIKSITEAAKADLQTYREAAENIKEVAQERLDGVREALSEEAMSHKKAAEEIDAIVAQETGQLTARFNQYIAARVKRRIDIERTPATSEKEEQQKAVDLKSFDTETRADILAQQKSIKQIGKLRVAANAASNKEDEQIRRAHNRFMLAMAAEQAKEELTIAREKNAAGMLLESQMFEAEVQAAKKEYENKRAVINDELDELKSKGPDAVNTKVYKDTLDKRALLDKEYTGEVEVQSLRRTEVLRQEQLRHEEYQNQMRASLLESEETLMQMTQMMSETGEYSAAMDNLFDLREREIAQLTRQTEAQLAIAEANNKESQTSEGLRVKLQALQNERLRAAGERISYAERAFAGDRGLQRIARGYAVRDEQQSLQTQLGQAFLNKDPLEIERVQNALKKLEKAFDRGAITITDGLKRTIDNIVGMPVTRLWEQATTGVEKFSIAARGVFLAAKNAVATYQSGAQQGGVLGGVGAVTSSVFGAMPEKLLKKIPVIGEFLPMIGEVLGFVGSMFTAAAKRIAADVKKSFEKTMEGYQNGSASLIDTINSLEQQRSQAIMRLSGKKGGRDELDKLLPEFDSAIRDLVKQQQELLTNFEDSLLVLRLHSDTLSKVGKQWQEINNQVKQYLGAGGDATKAAEFLSLSLQSIRKDAVDEFDKAEQEAIQDALKLNDLLEQRNQLVKDFAQQEFDLINQDAIERRQAGSVTRGKELEDLRKKNAEDLAKLDEEIRLTGVKVDREREVFNIASDVEALHRRDEELTLKALEEQVSKWKDLKAIIEGISLGAGGLWEMIPNLLPSFTAGNYSIVVNFNGNVNGDPEEVGRQVGDSIYDEMNRRNRMVPSYA